MQGRPQRRREAFSLRTHGHTAPRISPSARITRAARFQGGHTALEDLKKQAEEGLEKAKETIGEENVEKIVEVAKDKATEVASGLKDKFQK